MIKISIIIPTYNRCNQISKTLHSIIKLDTPSELFEIIVIDNGSTDDTKEIVDKYIIEYPNYHFKYFYDAIPGLLTGRHRGAKESQSEILCFIDDDVELSSTWANTIIDTMSERTDISFMTGPNLPKYDISPPDWLKYFWQPTPYGGKMCSELSLLDIGNTILEIDPIYVWGLNFTIRKSVFMELQGFHPDNIPEHLQMFQGDGETGISLKAKEKGHKALYHPDALLYHQISESRLSYEYFDKRYFYQGVCHSYTQIRTENALYSQIHIPKIEKEKNILYRIIIYAFGKLKGFISQSNDLPKGINKLKRRLWQKYNEGYRFHQKAYNESPNVRQWVLKENYFDYSIPGLKLK